MGREVEIEVDLVLEGLPGGDALADRVEPLGGGEIPGRGERVAALLEAREEARKVSVHKHGRVALVGLTRHVAARPRTGGHAPPLHPRGQARTQTKSPRLLLTVGATALEVVRPRRLLRPAWTRYATEVV